MQLSLNVWSQNDIHATPITKCLSTKTTTTSVDILHWLTNEPLCACATGSATAESSERGAAATTASAEGNRPKLVNQRRRTTRNEQSRNVTGS